jgi:cell division protein FtsB
MKELLDQLRVVFEKSEARIHQLVGKCNELEEENDRLRQELQDEGYIIKINRNYDRSSKYDRSRAQREFDCDF